MLSPTFKRLLVTLAVVIGSLAAAGPASAAGIEAAATPRTQVTMLDYEGSPVVTYSRAAPIGSTQTTSFVVDGPFSLEGTVGGCDVNVDLHPDEANLRVRRSAGGALVLAERIAVPPHTTQLALENTLVSNIAAADPEACVAGS